MKHRTLKADRECVSSNHFRSALLKRQKFLRLMTVLARQSRLLRQRTKFGLRLKQSKFVREEKKTNPGKPGIKLTQEEKK